jgi:sulfotransferase family protein
MKVIGAGLPRTATLSQKLALEALGFKPCYHMVNVLSDLTEAPRWRAALDGTLAPQEIFEGFQATVDWPGSYFYAELIEAHPDAKVVLSVRDGDAWARSMHDTIWGLFYDDVLMRHLSDARSTVDPMWRGYMDMMREMWRCSGLLNGDDTTLEWMSSAMQRYNAEVQRTVAPERLLVWQASDGWDPLCEFLEVPVPETPFPRVNDSAEFGQRIVDQALAVIGQHTSAEPVAGAPH